MKQKSVTFEHDGFQLTVVEEDADYKVKAFELYWDDEDFEVNDAYKFTVRTMARLVKLTELLNAYLQAQGATLNASAPSKKVDGPSAGNAFVIEIPQGKLVDMIENANTILFLETHESKDTPAHRLAKEFLSTVVK